MRVEGPGAMVLLDGVTPYPPDFIEHYQAAGYWQNQSMGAYFDELYVHFARRIALVAGNEHITYEEMGRRAKRLALHLLAIGIRPLDRIVLQLPNSPAFVYLYLALQHVGAIPILALPAHGIAEISQFVKVSGAVAYAFANTSEGEQVCLAEQLQREHSQLQWLFVAGDPVPAGGYSLTQLVTTESGLAEACLTGSAVEPLNPAVFQLSGGTTSIPKLIPRTHNDYLYNTRASAAITDIRPDDSLLVVLPMAHNFPLACPGVQGFWMYGARAVLSHSNRLEVVGPLIERERITHLELVPALLIRYLNDPTLRNYDFSSLRIINSGGQKLQPEVKRRVEATFPGCRVQEVFGMAEGLLCYVRLDDSDILRMETVGRPVSEADEIRLVDDAGNDVAVGEIGELLVRGPYTIRGYFRAPEQNALSFTPDGFYRTGDLLRQHPSGNYIVEGRKKDLINRGGEKISAEEIENLILGHAAVMNAACVPMPDHVLGERMCVFVVPQPGKTLTLEELVAFLRGKGIARFKLPERLELIEELPLSKFGKVSKRALIQLITEKLQREARSI